MIAKFMKYTTLHHERQVWEGDIPKKPNFLILQIGKCCPEGYVVNGRLVYQEAKVPRCSEPEINLRLEYRTYQKYRWAAT